LAAWQHSSTPAKYEMSDLVVAATLGACFSTPSVSQAPACTLPMGRAAVGCRTAGPSGCRWHRAAWPSMPSSASRRAGQGKPRLLTLDGRRLEAVSPNSRRGRLIRCLSAARRTEKVPNVMSTVADARPTLAERARMSLQCRAARLTSQTDADDDRADGARRAARHHTRRIMLRHVATDSVARQLDNGATSYPCGSR
jgi:hypothetical protein